MKVKKCNYMFPSRWHEDYSLGLYKRVCRLNVVQMLRVIEQSQCTLAQSCLLGHSDYSGALLRGRLHFSQILFPTIVCDLIAKTEHTNIWPESNHVIPFELSFKEKLKLISCNVRKLPSPFQLNNLFKGLSLDSLHIPRS